MQASAEVCCHCCLQNKINILDFSAIQSLFDKLNKQLEKAQKVTESADPPRLYIKLLVQLTVSGLAGTVEVSHGKA